MSASTIPGSGTVHTNGIDIYYRIDDVDGPWVMLAYALSVDHQLWDGIAQHLAACHHMLRYDAREHGKTMASHDAYTLSQMADDAAGLLDTLTVSQVYFIGLSMGGMVARTMGVWHPQWLLSLTLCDTVCVTPVTAHAMWNKRIGQIETYGMADIVKPTLQRWLTTPYCEARPDVAKRIRTLLRATSPHGYVDACLAIKALDTRGGPAHIVCPILVMTDEGDAGAPVEVVCEMASRIPNVRLKVTPCTAHLAPIERDEAFLTDLDEFLGHVGCGSQCEAL